jgi:hypothetical protein
LKIRPKNQRKQKNKKGKISEILFLNLKKGNNNNKTEKRKRNKLLHLEFEK